MTYASPPEGMLSPHTSSDRLATANVDQLTRMIKSGSYVFRRHGAKTYIAISKPDQRAENTGLVDTQQIPEICTVSDCNCAEIHMENLTTSAADVVSNQLFLVNGFHYNLSPILPGGEAATLQALHAYLDWDHEARTAWIKQSVLEKADSDRELQLHLNFLFFSASTLEVPPEISESQFHSLVKKMRLVFHSSTTESAAPVEPSPQAFLEQHRKLTHNLWKVGLFSRLAAWIRDWDVSNDLHLRPAPWTYVLVELGESLNKATKPDCVWNFLSEVMRDDAKDNRSVIVRLVHLSLQKAFIEGLAKSEQVNLLESLLIQDENADRLKRKQTSLAYTGWLLGHWPRPSYTGDCFAVCCIVVVMMLCGHLPHRGRGAWSANFLSRLDALVNEPGWRALGKAPGDFSVPMDRLQQFADIFSRVLAALPKFQESFATGSTFPPTSAATILFVTADAALAHLKTGKPILVCAAVQNSSVATHHTFVAIQYLIEHGQVVMWDPSTWDRRRYDLLHRPWNAPGDIFAVVLRPSDTAAFSSMTHQMAPRGAGPSTFVSPKQQQQYGAPPPTAARRADPNHQINNSVAGTGKVMMGSARTSAQVATHARGTGGGGAASLQGPGTRGPEHTSAADPQTETANNNARPLAAGPAPAGRRGKSASFAPPQNAPNQEGPPPQVGGSNELWADGARPSLSCPSNGRGGAVSQSSDEPLTTASRIPTVERMPPEPPPAQKR